jgi:hypothetical protein
MIEIDSPELGRIPLHGKAMIVFPAGCATPSYTNTDYDIILIVAGIDRSLTLNLVHPAIIIVEAGIRTTVQVHGLGVANSSVLFIAGLDNAVHGVQSQGRGRITIAGHHEFDIGSISSFQRIEIQ